MLFKSRPAIFRLVIVQINLDCNSRSFSLQTISSLDKGMRQSRVRQVSFWLLKSNAFKMQRLVAQSSIDAQ